MKIFLLAALALLPVSAIADNQSFGFDTTPAKVTDPAGNLNFPNRINFPVNQFATEGVVRNFGNSANKIPVINGSGFLEVGIIPTTLNPTTFTGAGVTSPFINKVAITAPASVATLTIGNNKTALFTGSLTVGADTVINGGGTLNLANFSVAVPADGTLAIGAGTLAFNTTSNAGIINHTHAITASANPGVAESLIKSDPTGGITLTNLKSNGGTFDLVNTVATTVNFAGSATAVGVGSAASGVTTLKSPTVSLTGTLVVPGTGYNTDIGQISKKVKTLHAAELAVETLVAQNTQATVGGRVLVGPTTLLIADLAPAATTIDVKHNNLASGDRVRMEDSGQVEFMAITSGPTTITGGFRYNVTRNLDGTGADQWYAGDAVFNTGQTGSGFIDLYSLQSTKSASQAGPTIVGWVRNSSTYNDYSERWAIGNLIGLYGFGTTTFGAGFGRYGVPNETWATIETGLGYRLGTNITTRFNLSAAGNFLLGSDISAPSTTSLVIVGSATGFTYNGEGLAMGDLLLGDNSTGIANFRWNRANNRFEWRSGQTVKGYIDANATFNIGAGRIQLGVTPGGLRFDNTIGVPNSVNWNYGGGGQASLGSQDGGANERQTTIETSATATTGYTQNITRVFNNSGNGLAFLIGINNSATTPNAGKSYATFHDLFGVTFDGLVVGANVWPTHKLDVYGTGLFRGNLFVGLGGTGATIAELKINGGSGTPGGGQLAFQDNGTTRAAIGTEPNVIGSGSRTKMVFYSTNNTFMFYGVGAGTWTTDGSGNVIVTSTERMKDIAGDYARGLDDLLDIHPKIGKWKEETGLDRKQDYVWPVTAENALETIPEGVGVNDNGDYTLDQAALHAVEINSIKELHARLLVLEGKQHPARKQDDRGSKRRAELAEIKKARDIENEAVKVRLSKMESSPTPTTAKPTPEPKKN